MKKVDIIVPILNEKENISELVRRIHKNLSGGQVEYGIIFVDDHSIDGSSVLIKKLSKKYPIKYLLKKGKLGKAYSILEGAKASKAEYVAMIDGDLQYPPEAIAEMLRLAHDKELGVVVANRVKANTSIIRKIVSKSSRFVIGNLIMGMPCDIQSGLKIFKQNIAAHIEEKNLKPWAFDVSLVSTARQLGESWGCTEIEFSERKSGKSKIAFVSGTLQVISSALGERFRKKKVYQLGEGEFAYKSQKFNTHNNLHHSKSAFHTLTSGQKLFFGISFLIIILSLILFTHTAQVMILAVISVIYFLDLAFGFYLIMKSLNKPPEITFGEKELENLDSGGLPVYTILCPLYRESRILPKFIENIEALDYPKNKLEVLLLLESDDKHTIKAARNLKLPDYVRILIVPDKLPKTKPKACNFGLKHATGEYVVIYDAEDRPEPLQLKKAYLAFQKSGPEVFCLQAKLNYYNPHQNLLTRLFTAEYSLWFDVILPGLQSIETTIPLGGTSNHFRTNDLKDIGGWDAFNVTEDADLGVRIFKQGYKTAIFDSITLEEANSNIKNWIRQRSRWIKGYFQTYLVHTRESIKFARESKGHFFIFQLVSGLRMSFMLINPFLWTMTIAYFVLYKFVGPQIEALFPPAVFYIAGTSAVFGNFLYLYYYMIGAAKRGQWEIIKYIFFVPFYWLLTSIGAFIALYQLIVKPHFWEKTIHGFHLQDKKPSYLHRFSKTRLGMLIHQGWLAGGVLVFASMVSNVLNFLYNAFLGREVDVTEFGTVSLIGSIFAIVGIFTSAFSKSISYRTAYLFGKFGYNINGFTRSSEKQAWTASAVMTVMWFLAIPFMSVFFNTTDFLPFILFIPAISVSFISSYYSGYLNGSLMFSTISMITVVESVTKLILAIILVKSGLQHLVYAAVPLSLIPVFVLMRRKYRTIKQHDLPQESSTDDIQFPKAFFGTSIITKLSSIAFLSFDILLAKHFLPPFEAGQYALLSLTGKIIFFLGSLFSQFINPFVSKNEGASLSSKTVFRNIFLLAAGSVSFGYVVLGIFGHITAPILFGEKARQITHLLPVYCLAIAAFALSSVIINYHQVKRRWIFPVTGSVFAVIEIVWVSINSSSLNTFSLAFSQVAIVQFLVIFVMGLLFSNLKSLANNFKDLTALTKFRPAKNPEGKNRILIFNWRDMRHAWGGGAEVYIHEISKRLVKKGYQVTLFSGNDGKSPRNEKVDGVQVIRRGGFYTVYFWAFIYYVLRLRKYFDIIIDSENGIPFFTPLYTRKKIFLLIHHVHQEVFRMKLHPPFSWIGKFLEKKIMPIVYKKAEIITVSPSSKKDILFHKLTQKDPHVVYNGVDTSKYKPGKKSKSPLVLYLGRLTPQKSLTVLISSARTIIKKVPTVKFIIAGEGDDRKKLMSLVEKLKLEKYFTFTGKVTEEEKINLYQKAWVFVNPSLIEGWGITTIEANACGTPVIASDVAGLRDSVRNPHSGYLVPYGNTAEFSDKVSHLLKNQQLRDYMSGESIKWAKKFDWLKSANQIISLL